MTVLSSAYTVQAEVSIVIIPSIFEWVFPIPVTLTTCIGSQVRENDYGNNLDNPVYDTGIQNEGDNERELRNPIYGAQDEGAVNGPRDV